MIMKKMFTPIALMVAFIFGMSCSGSLKTQPLTAAQAQLANVIVETTPGKLVSPDGTATYEFKIVYDLSSTSGQPFLLVNVYRDGVKVGTTDRFKMSGNRVAQDEPGVDSQYFVTDANGRIIDG
jgi:hypothetical protein